MILYRLGFISTMAAGKGDSKNDFGLYEIYRNAETDALIESWTLTEQLLMEIKRLAESHGARFAVVLVSAPWEVYPELWQTVLNRLPAMRQVTMDLDKPSRRLTSFLQRRGIPYVDLLPGFRVQARSAALFFQQDNHWTADGHRLAVDLIVDKVTSMFRDNDASAEPASAAVSRDESVGPFRATF
jgi:hypothetical protein